MAARDMAGVTLKLGLRSAEAVGYLRQNNPFHPRDLDSRPRVLMPTRAPRTSALSPAERLLRFRRRPGPIFLLLRKRKATGQQLTALPAPEYEHVSATMPFGLFSVALSPSLFQT
jgi:hypothetical protein